MSGISEEETFDFAPATESPSPALKPVQRPNSLTKPGMEEQPSEKEPSEKEPKLTEDSTTPKTGGEGEVEEMTGGSEEEVYNFMPETPAPALKPVERPYIPDLYNCSIELDSWKTSWTPGVQSWCCEEKNVGCPELNSLTKEPLEKEQTLPTMPPLPDPYNCDVEYDTWKTAWTPDWAAWCCLHQKRGCLDTDRDAAQKETKTEDMEPLEKTPEKEATTEDEVDVKAVSKEFLRLTTSGAGVGLGAGFGGDLSGYAAWSFVGLALASVSASMAVAALLRGRGRERVPSSEEEVGIEVPYRATTSTEE